MDFAVVLECSTAPHLFVVTSCLKEGADLFVFLTRKLLASQIRGAHVAEACPTADLKTFLRCTEIQTFQFVRCWATESRKITSAASSCHDEGTGRRTR